MILTLDEAIQTIERYLGNGMEYRNAYAEILQHTESINIPEPDPDDRFRKELQSGMDHLNGMCQSPDAPATRLAMGMHYLSRTLYKWFKNQNIGLPSLSIESNQFRIEIHPGVNCLNAAQEQQKWKEGTGLDVLPVFNHLRIRNTPENVRAYMEKLSGIMDVQWYETEAKHRGADTWIGKITVSAKRIHPKETESVPGTNLLQPEELRRIQELVAKIKSMRHDWNTIGDTTIWQCFVGSWYDLHVLLDAKTTWSESYKAIHCANADANRQTHDAMMEIGRSVPPDEILELFKDVTRKLEPYLENQYGLTVTKTSYTNRLRVELIVRDWYDDPKPADTLDTLFLDTRNPVRAFADYVSDDLRDLHFHLTDQEENLLNAIEASVTDECVAKLMEPTEKKG